MHRILCRLLAPPAALLLTMSIAAPARAATVPLHDHVVVVVMENISYAKARVLPYVQSLMASGAWFGQYFAIAHPSQPNYFVLFSGATQGVTSDACPAFGSPFSTANLGQACEANGLTWRAYSENLAEVGSDSCSYDGNSVTGLYTRKHEPWTYFTNVDHQNERPYSDLAADIAAGQLPNLAYIIPNNCDNAHNASSDPNCNATHADQWLAANLPPVIQALGPHGLLVLTWDEDEGNAGNNILTVFVGPQVLTGAINVNFVTHYTLVRTIADALGVPPPGLSANQFPITNVWDYGTQAPTATWGQLKLLYR